MKVYIDGSIFTKDPEDAFGNVHGHIELPIVPQIGDDISFVKHNVDSSSLDDIKVMHRSIATASTDPDAEKYMVSLSLADIIVPTRKDALELAHYFEEGFGLWVDIYADENGVPYT